MLTVYVTLRSVPQRLEQSVITAIVPNPHGAKNVRKQKLLQDIPNSPLTTSVCHGNRPISTSQYGQWRDFLWLRNVTLCVRTVAHVNLYIGLFQPRTGEELSALTVDGCRYASVRVTNSNSGDTEYGDKKCNESNKRLQTKISTISCLGRHPPSANRNNVGVQ